MTGGEFSGTARYEIVRRLGSGGMGVVYEAIDRERQCRVALKTVETPVGDALLRLKNEFRAFQDLEHPNLVSLGELCEESGRWFFTMELIRGVDFLHHVRPSDVREDSPGVGSTPTHPPGVDTWQPAADVPTRSPEPAIFDEERLRRALEQLCLGLVTLHEAGRVHRDIKPSNILVTDTGRVVLLDFGLATGVARADQSSVMHPVGTFEYMAPEQAASKPVGPESDWYSVGVLLYQALTGRVPFTGAPLEVMINKQHLEPEPPSRVASQVPADLESLCMDLLRFEPTERLSGQAVLERLGVSHVPSRPAVALSTSFTQTPPFVGRAQELAELDAAFRETTRGRAAAVLVLGESGIGKTALVRQFTDRVRSTAPDAVILSGRCFEREAVPYKAIDGIIDTLSRYLTRLPEGHAAAMLPRAAALLGRVFPVLRRVKAVAEAPLSPGDTGIDPQQLRTRLFAAMRELMSRLTDRHPVVMAIDDLQWVDTDSLALLGEMMRPPDAPGLLLVATLRITSEAVGQSVVPEVASSLTGDVRLLRVTALPEAEARALAGLLLARAPDSSSSAAASIAAEARGHPLFIDELVRHVSVGDHSSGGTLRFEQVLRERIAALPEEARQVLAVVATAGAPIPQEVALRAVAMAPAQFARCVALLRVGNLVQTTGGRGSDTVGTYHDRVRDAVLGGSSEETRQRRHRELALALEAFGGADAQVLAEHWHEAGEVERAVAYTVQAAAEAEASLAFGHAAELYRRAVALRPDRSVAAALLVKLADAAANAGRGAEAAATYLKAAPDMSPPEALELQRRAADNLLRSGHVDEGQETLKSVLQTMGIHRPASPTRAYRGAVLQRVALRFRGFEHRERDESQVAPEELGRIDVCWSAASALGMVDCISGAYFNARALRLALQAGEPTRLLRVFALETIIRSVSGRSSRERAASMLRRTQSLATRVRTAEGRAWALMARGVADFLNGRFRSALERLESAEPVFRNQCTGTAWELDTLRLFLLHSLSYLGAVEEISRRVPYLLGEALDRGDLYCATNLRLGMLNLAWLVADDFGEARRMVADASAGWSQQGFHLQHWYDLLAQSQLDLYVGDGVSAHERLRRRWSALERSMLLKVQLLRIEALCLRARSALAAASASGSPRELIAEAERDARRISREGMRWSEPLANLIQAGAAALSGWPEEAAGRLDAATRGFEAAGMALHAALAMRRRGMLVGGTEGQALLESSGDWLAGQRIANVDGWSAVFAPGFKASGDE